MDGCTSPHRTGEFFVFPLSNDSPLYVVSTIGDYKEIFGVPYQDKLETIQRLRAKDATASRRVAHLLGAQISLSQASPVDVLIKTAHN